MCYLCYWQAKKKKKKKKKKNKWIMDLLQTNNWCTGVVWITCDVFISCLDHWSIIENWIAHDVMKVKPPRRHIAIPQYSHTFYWINRISYDFNEKTSPNKPAFLDSHSDGTHSLQRIYWWASVMLHFSKFCHKPGKSSFKISCLFISNFVNCFLGNW